MIVYWKIIIMLPDKFFYHHSIPVSMLKRIAKGTYFALLPNDMLQLISDYFVVYHPITIIFNIKDYETFLDKYTKITDYFIMKTVVRSSERHFRLDVICNYSKCDAHFKIISGKTHDLRKPQSKYPYNVKNCNKLRIFNSDTYGLSFVLKIKIDKDNFNLDEQYDNILIRPLFPQSKHDVDSWYRIYDYNIRIVFDYTIKCKA